MSTKISSINQKQKDKVYVASVLDTRRPTISGLFIVRTRVTQVKQQVYYPTGVELTVDEWLRMPKALN